MYGVNNFLKTEFFLEIPLFVKINVNTFAVLFEGLLFCKQKTLLKLLIADVAQLVEQLICNQPVGGSSPSIGSLLGRFQSGQMGQTVNLLAKPSEVRILLSPQQYVLTI